MVIALYLRELEPEQTDEQTKFSKKKVFEKCKKKKKEKKKISQAKIQQILKYTLCFAYNKMSMTINLCFFLILSYLKRVRILNHIYTLLTFYYYFFSSDSFVFFSKL